MPLSFNLSNPTEAEQSRADVLRVLCQTIVRQMSYKYKIAVYRKFYIVEYFLGEYAKKLAVVYKFLLYLLKILGCTQFVEK